MTVVPKITFVLGSYNRRAFLKETIQSIRNESEGIEYEILVVDGGSKDGATEWLIRQKDIITIVQHNRGYWAGMPIIPRSWGYFMNLAFRNASGDIICMLSDDCILVPGSIKSALACWAVCEKPIGAMPFYWRNGGPEGEYFVSSYAGTPFVNHGFYSRSALVNVGFADEVTFGFYAGDIDICLKLASNGYHIFACDQALVEHWPHLPGETRPFNEAKMEKDFEALKQKWKHRPEWSRQETRIVLNFCSKDPNPLITREMRSIESKMKRLTWFPDLMMKIRRKCRL